MRSACSLHFLLWNLRAVMAGSGLTRVERFARTPEGISPRWANPHGEMPASSGVLRPYYRASGVPRSSKGLFSLKSPRRPPGPP